MDHDQRFKTLLKEFFASFLALFFPDWLERFDLVGITWLEQELFPDPPQGESLRLDLVGQVPIRPDEAGPRPNEPADLLVLIHVEIESAESAAAFRERFYRYYHHLHARHGRAVLPIAVFLRVALEGRGVDRFEHRFWERTPLVFEYDYVGLPGLNGAEFVDRDNWLGVALSALMRWRREERVPAAARAIERLLNSGVSDYHKYLLYECVDAYAPLQPDQRLELIDILREPKRGTWPMVETLFEKARKEGRQEGKLEGRLEGKQEGEREGRLAGRRELLRLQLENRFGPLPAGSLERLSMRTGEQLDDLALRLLSAASLAELGLE